VRKSRFCVKVIILSDRPTLLHIVAAVRHDHSSESRSKFLAARRSYVAIEDAVHCKK